MTSRLRQARVDLAAALRWAARMGYQQGVCNHFSLLAPDSDDLFLVNPEGFFWSEITASSLLLCDLDGTIVEGTGTVELSAFSLHAPIHRRNKAAKAVLHTHSPYATALCLIRDARVEPVFLPGFQFFGKIAYDDDCHGAAFSAAEGDREAAILGDKNVLMMRNHGPLVVGPTIAAAFDRLYYLEDTCQRQMLAMSAGRPLQPVADAVAASLAGQVPVFDAYAEKHLTAIKRVLDREEPDYSS
ncbi:MAG TPA: aldolase [Steroidobacteraceae bacterium]|jgi:ribulose-5-phosphate 4-epimerase/fuculose-1-phosphate aldolase|nr:aldolase [Steroidobacteraceae bacterium]